MTMAATAVIGSTVIGGYMQSQSQKSAARSASQAQNYATQQATQVQREALAQIQQNLAPFIESGGPALQQMGLFAMSTVPAQEMQQDIIGMNGPEAQQAAISRIESDPLFQTSMRYAEDALLQNAAATGGIRGGNTQAALSYLRPQMLQSEIARQYDMLGGQASAGLGLFSDIAKLSEAAGAHQASTAMTGASNIGNALMAAGDANAQAALARGQANANMWGNIAGSVGSMGTLGMMGYGPLASGGGSLSGGTVSAPYTQSQLNAIGYGG